MFRQTVFGKILAAPLLLLGLGLTSWDARSEMVNGEDLVDPTAPFLLRADSNMPLINAFALFNSYEVSSILIRSDMRIAVVNSQRVRIGDRVGNADILSIESDRVTISLNGETRDLMLHGSSVKSLSDADR